jgi:ABC-type phosphate transport system substrate-binding protein
MKSLFLFSFLLFFNAITWSQTSQLGGLKLIGNSIGVSELSVKKIQDIFRGKQSMWPSDEQVVVVIPSNKCEFSELFAKQVFNSSHSAVQKYWLALVFQGRANAPIFLQNSKEMLEYIRKNPGTIALVNLSESEIPPSLLIKIKP